MAPKSVSRDGITALNSSTGKTLDIVLVHGLNGDPQRTWTSPQTKFFWPEALDKGLPHARILVFGYNTDISPSDQRNNTRIRGIALSFLNKLSNARQEDDEVNRPLIMIGHSLGGLVIKHALIKAAHDPGNDRGEIYRSLKCVMFFGTPHAGSSADQKKRVQLLKKMAKVAFTEVPPKIEALLEMHSDELLDMADDFRKIDICKHNRLHIYSFYEELDTKMLGERVVDEYSSRAGTAIEEALPIHADHENMVKFADENDQNYKDVIATIKKLQRLTNINPDPNIVNDNTGPKTTKCMEIPKERKVAKFVGREDILTEIAKIFEPAAASRSSSPIKMSLIGMGGIGKSQIALEYCQKAHTAELFRTVFWINAHSEDTVVSSLVKIARKISPHERKHSSREEDVDYVLTCFQSWPHPFLLVFDNFDDPGFDEVLRYIPAIGAGAVLFTSRLAATEHLMDASINVNVLDESASLQLLEARSGMTASAQSAEQKYAKEIVGILDGLPLAIDQAGAYIRASGRAGSFNKFLTQYNRRRQDILNEKHLPRFWKYKEVVSEKEKARNLSVYTTWELSLKLLGVDADDHQKKTHFLTLAAFLGGHRVSKVLFKCYLRIFKLAGELKDNNHWSSIFDDSNEFDGTLFRDVVVELNELSLIRGFEETAYGALHFNVHSVVREWIVYRADTQSKRAFLTEAVDIMENFFLKFESDISWNPDLYKVVTHDLDGPLEDIDIGTLVGDMLQETVGHVRACIRLSKEIGPEFTGWRPVEKFFASVLCAVGDIEAALTIWERILEHYKAKFGESHGDVLMLMGVICSLKIQNGVTPEGIAALEALVTKMNYIQGSEHPTSLIWNVQLIQAYSELGQQTRTVDKMLELSEIFRQMKGKRTEPSSAARNLLPCLISYKHLDAAEDLLWEELQLCPEGDWSAYQFCQTALSNLLIAQNNISEAEECINDLIGLATEHFGTKDHPQIIGAEWTLSKCFAIQKRWKDAVATGAPFYQYVLKVLGPVHWITQEKALELAGYWINFKPADMTWPNATINMLINECTNLYGLNSNKTLRLRIRATDVYYKNGQYQLAFQLIKETRKIHCTTLDITDEQRIRTEDFCVKALGKMPNRKEEDVQFFADLHAGRLSNLEELLGEDNELTIRCRRAHATFLFNIDRFQSALPLYEKQRDILLKTSGDNSETYWDTSGAFANCLYRASKYAEAISLYERTLDWRKNSLDHNVEEDWDMRHWLACCYWKTGRYVEATNLFRDILDWKKRTYGPDDHRVFNTVRPQVLCFRESGQLEEAEKLCKILLDHDIRKSGETNEATIKTRTWLANIYDTAKKLAEAIEQFNILLERKTKQGLAEDPETNRIVARLASSLYDKEKYAEAEPYYRTNLAWRQKHRSTDYDGLILGTSNLAICLGKLNRYAEAVPYYKESATMKKAVYGADDERTMQALVSLGGTHILAGKPHLNLATRHIALQHFAEAIEPLSRAAEWTRTKNGPNVEITIAWVQILGDAYFGLGKLGEAKTCRSEVLLACEHLFGPYHGKTHHAVTQMRDVEMESGEFANAETYAVREMECLQREGADKQRMIEQAYVLGICRVQQGKYAEAAQDVAVCFAWKKEHLGLANHATIRTGYWHARCLEAFESYGAAVEHYELVVGWKGDVPPTWTKFQDDAKERLESCRRQAAMHGNIGKLKFSE